MSQENAVLEKESTDSSEGPDLHNFLVAGHFVAGLAQPFARVLFDHKKFEDRPFLLPVTLYCLSAPIVALTKKNKEKLPLAVFLLALIVFGICELLFF